MPKLKVGDSFIYTEEMERAKRYSPCNSIQRSYIGEWMIVESIESCLGSLEYRCAGKNGFYHTDIIDPYLNLTTKQSFMFNLLEKFKMALKTEPDKSLIETGITQNDGDLTSEGKELFIQWLFTQNKEAFAKDVLPKLKDSKEGKK